MTGKVGEQIAGAGWRSRRVRLAQIAVGLVLVWNLSAAVPFVWSPERYVLAFQLAGVPGEAMVRSLGLLFLMWCVAYVPVIARPDRHLVLFGVILAQQAIGLTGEAWMLATLPAGYNALAATGLRFMLFDGAGLVLLLLAFVLARPRAR
ncbi:MAG: hypothetical protein FJZ97_01960 [Chloroflexi bacterium]|nr:hypothetical protein [Chloroflexota bacterium]